MIDDMLDIARIAAGKLRLELRPVDLLRVVLAAVDVVIALSQREADQVRTVSTAQTRGCSAIKIACSRWSGTSCPTP